MRLGAAALLNGVLQFPRIFLKSLFGFERLMEEFEQVFLGSFIRICEAIEDAEAVPSINHQSLILHVLQMARNVGLGCIQDVLDVTPAQLAMQQQIENSEPIGISQSLEVPFQLFHAFHLSKTNP